MCCEAGDKETKELLVLLLRENKVLDVMRYAFCRKSFTLRSSRSSGIVPVEPGMART